MIYDTTHLYGGLRGINKFYLTNIVNAMFIHHKYDGMFICELPKGQKKEKLLPIEVVVMTKIILLCVTMVQQKQSKKHILLVIILTMTIMI